ncbi:hypothetical protein [Pedobacter antarcticus]|uniref:hypothetical protein n=2 Tax=Pedobacter antarcticus TaxID=34086 RepID=UPI001C561BFF|nr:hypothetical protein [Pedobacter antarcticus]
MNMVKLSHVEQLVNSPILNFECSDGSIIDILKSDLLAFIDEYGLNISTDVDFNSYDYFDQESEAVIDADIYLDDNFKLVTQLFFESKIAGSF